jgi:nitroreductase
MVRSFTADPVPGEVLGKILDGALRSPSAGNTGGWTIVVLQGAQTLAYWEATTTPQWRHRSRRWPGLSRAPVALVLFTDPGAYVARYGEPDKAGSGLGPEGGTAAWEVPYWFVDAGMALMSVLVGAVDAGLGACLLGNFRGEEALRRSLGVPPGWRHAGTVLLGRASSDDIPSPSLHRGRRAPTTAIRWGTWAGGDTPG